jgi:hypothetical protein
LIDTPSGPAPKIEIATRPLFPPGNGGEKVNPNSVPGSTHPKAKPFHAVAKFGHYVKRDE